MCIAVSCEGDYQSLEWCDVYPITWCLGHIRLGKTIIKKGGNKTKIVEPPLI